MEMDVDPDHVPGGFWVHDAMVSGWQVSGWQVPRITGIR
jgi:hypothetical protein